MKKDGCLRFEIIKLNLSEDISETVDFSIFEVVKMSKESIDIIGNITYLEFTPTDISSIAIIVSEIETDLPDDIIPESYFKHDITILYA